MSNVVLLTKILIKNNVFAFSGKNKKKETSSRLSAIGFILVMLICTLLVAIPMVIVICDLLSLYDLSELLISLIIPLGGVTSIIFGVFSIISIFYFSKDNEQLLPLPIKSSELLMAKFFASLISEYLILIMFIFPLIFGIGIGMKAGIAFYFYATSICFLMPLIPSVIIAIILMLSNKICDFGKRKDLFMYIMTGVIIIFAFAYTYGLESFLSVEDNAAILTGNFLPILNYSKWIFPFFNSAVYTLKYYNTFLGFASFITFIGINLLALIILYFVGDKLYIKGITKSNGDKKQNNKDYKKYKGSKGGVSSELLKKEWLSIKRTPVFMLNIIIFNLIFPLIFIGGFVIGFKEENLNLSSLLDYVNLDSGGLWLIVIGVLVFISSMSSSASSAISREGSSAYVMKTIPVSLKKQLDIKILFSFIIDFIILLAMEIPLFLLLNIPFKYFILINIPLILIILISDYVSLLLDLNKPKLDWKEENEAIKQNFNVFMGMIISLISATIFIVLGVFLFNSSVNIYLIFSLLSVILLVMYLVINILVKKNERKLFSKVG